MRKLPKDVLKMASGLISPSGLAGHRRPLCIGGVSWQNCVIGCHGHTYVVRLIFNLYLISLQISTYVGVSVYDIGETFCS